MARLTVQNPTQHKFNTKNFLFFLRVLYIQKKTADITTVEVYEQLI